MENIDLEVHRSCSVRGWFVARVTCGMRDCYVSMLSNLASAKRWAVRQARKMEAGK
jgi:hypothetical protein